MSEQGDAIVHAAPAGGPSVRIVAVGDPGAEAAAYAQRLGADVGTDRATVQRAIDARVEAGRALDRDPDDPTTTDDDDGDADLLARAASIRAAATAPPIGEAELARLRRLAEELARAGRIRAHTERRFEERSRAASAGAAPTPSPDDVLEAATAVVEAEAALDRARDAMLAAEQEPLPLAVDRAEPAPTAARPGGLLSRLRSSLGTERDEHAATPGPDAFGSGLLAERDAAEERVQQAWAHWVRLAGREADPYAPEAVLRPPDPQLAYVAAAPDPTASPTLAAVAAFHRKVQARWRVMWASVGGGEPPEPEHLDVALEGLDGRRRRAAAEITRLERAERRQAAAALLARPLVIVQPGTWTGAEELRRLLAPLPPTAQVIVLERRGA